MIINFLLSFFLTSLSCLINLLPRSFALKIGRIIGLAGYYFFRRRRQLALDNLQQAMGNELSPQQQNIIIKNMFINLGMNLIEFVQMQKINKSNLAKYIRYTGLEYLESALAKKQGVLALTAHIGNWELLAASMAIRGINTAIVVKTARQKAVNNFLTKARSATGLKVLHGKNMIKDILKQCKSGGMVGIVLDQSALKQDAVVVPFFGRHASTLKSLAVLSMRTEAVILPIYIYRENEKHHIIIEPPIENIEKSTPEETITARTELYTKSIENAIRRHPDQWTWSHNRWKIRR